MIEKNGAYIYGNLAEKPEYKEYEEHKEHRKVKKAGSSAKTKIKVVFTVLMVFLACFVVVYRYAAITSLNYEIKKAEKIYYELKNENANLLVQIKQETDLNKIRQIAETKLNMQKPDKSQTVYVNVPKNDYTIVTKETEKPESTKDGIFAVLAEKINQLINLLY